MPPYCGQKEMDIFSREKHAFMDREQSRLLYPGRSPGHWGKRISAGGWKDYMERASGSSAATLLYP